MYQNQHNEVPNLVQWNRNTKLKIKKLRKYESDLLEGEFVINILRSRNFTIF